MLTNDKTKKCTGKDGGRLCRIREMCIRFTSESEGVDQFWIGMEASAVNGKCSNYLHNGNGQIVGSMPSIDTTPEQRLIVEFEDHGQPFKEWVINAKTGKVLSSTPEQNNIWTYYYVSDPEDLHKGSRVLVYHATDRIKYLNKKELVRCIDTCHKVKSIRKEVNNG